MTCALCRKWNAPSAGAELGECRARPPQAFMLAVNNAPGLDGKTGLRVNFPAAFPATPANAWCGEFEAGLPLPALES